MQIGETVSLGDFQPKKVVQKSTSVQQPSRERSAEPKPAATTMTRQAEQSTKQPQTLLGAISTGWKRGVNEAKAEARRLRGNRTETQSEEPARTSGATFQDRVDNVKHDLKKVWRRLRE